MSPIPNRASDAGPEPRHQDPDKPIPSEDAIVERLTKYLAEFGWTSDRVRDFSGNDWEDRLFDLNIHTGYTDAMCARVVARLLQAEIEDRAKDLDWQRRTAEAAELREEQEWDAAQMSETGAMRCPPKE